MTEQTTRQKIVARVESDLRHYPFRILGKILLVHLLIGTLTLLVCPQFGVSLFRDQLGLMKFFMQFGPQACALLCGSLFLGTSAVALSLILKPGERLYLKHYRYRIFSALAVGSLLLFLGINGSNLETLSATASLEYKLVWLVSAIASACWLHSSSKKIKRPE